MTIRLADAITMQLLGNAAIVAGHAGLQRRVSWVHIVDLPEPGPWINRNQLLLTTGYAWSNEETSMRNLIRELDSRGIAGIGLAVPSYYDAFPDVAKMEADRVGLPLLEIPWELPFATISESFNRAIISEQQRHREQAYSIHRSLTRSSIEADSLDEIVSEFSRLLQRTVVLEDDDGNIIASQIHSDTPSIGPPNRCVGSGGAIQSFTQSVDPGYWASIRHTQSAIRVPASAVSGPGSLIACPVWLKRELVGILWVPDDGEPLKELDIQAVEHAATIIALHVARERAVVDVEQRLRYTLIDSLLEGQFTGDALSLERATLMGFDAAAEYRVVIFVLDQSIPLSRQGYMRRERFVDRLTRKMTQLGHAPLISPSLNEVSVVVPGSMSFEALGERLLDNDVSAAAGRRYSGIDGVRQSYLEARSVIDWTRPNDITSYDELLLPRLLQGDSDAREHFMAGILRPLQGVLHSDLYIETLRQLAADGFNQSKAAKQLCLHPKTVQYRVNRIEELIGLDLSLPDVRFRVQLLCQLMDIGERKSRSSRQSLTP